MAKIPFTVSARTARLIGGQNFSNAEGAIIELVKNCYDADAKKCIVFFDNRLAEIPKALSVEEFKAFKDMPELKAYYFWDEKTSGYVLDFGENKPFSLNEDERKVALEKIKHDKEALRKFFRSKTNLYIIDDGEGMTDEVTRLKFWSRVVAMEHF